MLRRKRKSNYIRRERLHGLSLFVYGGFIFMAKQRIKFDEETTNAVQILCDYHGLSVEELFIKLVMDEWERNYNDIHEKGLA